MRPSRNLVSVLTVTLFVASFLQVGASRAVAQSLAVCTFQTRNHAEPGFAIAPVEGIDRASGTILCFGSLEGRQLRQEAGTIAFVFHYKAGGVLPALDIDGCIVYEGRGLMDVMLPTDNGTLALRGTFESFGSQAGEVHGRLGQSPFQGTVAFSPDPAYLDENCLTKPLQHFLTIGQLVFTT